MKVTAREMNIVVDEKKQMKKKQQTKIKPNLEKCSPRDQNGYEVK